MSNQISLRSVGFITNKSTEFVKPSRETPSETLSLSTLDNDPLNEVMYATLHAYKANDETLNQPESLLRQALSDLLVYYYPLSGKLKRRGIDQRLELRCTAGEDGVPFTVASAGVELSSVNYLDSVDVEIITSLFVPEFDSDYDSEIGYHPLALQVTKFACGGFTIGAKVTHAVCDGFGVAHLIHALTELAGGKGEPTVLPIWDRHRLVGQIDDRNPKIPGANIVNLMAVSPYMPTTDLVTETVNIKAASIKRMKDAIQKESEFPIKENITTFEVISVCTWRSRSRALELNPNGITVFGISVGIRHAVDPPLPKGYYGNAYIDVYVELTARELDELPISDIVKLVKRAKKRAYDKEYVEEELRNTERLMKSNVVIEGRYDGLFFLTDLRNIGFFGSMDFGWNEPVNVLTLMPLEKSKNIGMILCPSKLDSSMEGGVKLIMTLPRPAMDKFKEEMEYSLSKFAM